MAFTALQHRNFRLLWLGQFASFSGSMMQTAAILWHVSLLVPEAHKGLALGLVGLVRIMPIIVFSLLAGVAADALNRRKLMLLTQTLLALSALVLAAITFRGLSVVWPLYVLTALNAAIGSFDNPARQSLIPVLVPREHLPNAISLNTIMFQTAAVLGPGIGGLLIARADLGWVYGLNTASYLCVIGMLLLMRGVPAHGAGSRQQVSLQAAVDGLRFVFRAPLIRSTMLLDFFATFFASALSLLPIFAQDILRVGAQGYGWLYAAPSAGAMLASLVLVRTAERVERRGHVLLWAVAVYCGAVVVFGLSRSFWLTFACLAVTGAADTVSTVFRQIIRQLSTPDHLRGRMVSVNMLFFAGGPQLGEAKAGLLASAVGAPLAVVTGGLAALVATLWLARVAPSLRSYRRDDALTAFQAAAAD
jgi:MFS family permease